MKTDLLTAGLTRSYPQKLFTLAKTDEEINELKIVRRQAFPTTYGFHATSTFLNDPDNWDEQWFSSYE